MVNGLSGQRVTFTTLDFGGGAKFPAHHAPEFLRPLRHPRGRSVEARQVELIKGPNISGLPNFDQLPDLMEAPVLLTVGDKISTDEISPAGRALRFRSNISTLAEFTLHPGG